MARAQRRARTRAKGSALAAALAGALAGCSLSPAYAPPPLPAPPAAYKESGAWTEARPGDALPRGAWWSVFRDPVLDGLETRLEAANPTLAAALATYDQARAAAVAARSNLYPDVTAVGAGTYNRQSDNRPLRGGGQPNEYAANTLGLQAAYEVDLWGRVRDLVAGAGARAEASGADLASARLSLRARLADDYLALRGLDAQATLLGDTVAAYRRALDLTRARHVGGAASGLDEDRASAQLSSAKAAISDVAAERAILEHQIAALVGQSASTFSLPPAPPPGLIPEVPAGVPSTLVQRRPDVAAAERRAFAANRDIGVARAAFFPTLSLVPQGGFQNTGQPNLLVAPDTFWTVGPEAALTLFDGGRRRAAVASARAGFRLASADYRATVIAAFQEVEDQLALSNHLAAEASDRSDAVRATRGAASLSLIRYREGATNYLDVVTAQTAELDAERIALDLQTRRQRAVVDLVRALGGGWTLADDPPRPGEAAKLARAGS